MLFGQSGGKSVYPFLNLPFSAKVASLGGNIVSLDDKDPNISLENPGYQSGYGNRYAIFNYIWYMAGINYGNFLFNYKPSVTDNYAIGFKYLNYGHFEGRDISGTPQGSFTAADYSLDLIWNRNVIDSVLSIGTNIKPIFSQLEDYSSFGLVADFGLFYHLYKQNLSVGIVLKNLGRQIKAYSQVNEVIRPDLEIGVSKRLAHAPFRFSVTAYHLFDYNLDYDLVQQQSSLSGFSDQVSKNTFLTSALKHFIFAVEFLPSNSFAVNLGYNYLRRSEMSVDGVSSLAGYSFGFSLKLSKFMFSYGRSAYHTAGGSDLFSLVYKL